MSVAPDVVIPPFPSKDSLAAFFRSRSPVRLASASYLLAIPEHEICARVADETAFVDGDSIPWVDVARWLFEVWPLSRLRSALPDSVLPDELRDVALRAAWSIPTYLVTALEHQAYKRMRPDAALRGLSPQDYVVAVLRLAVEAATFEDLRDEEGFLDAFFFPETEHERVTRIRRIQRRQAKDAKPSPRPVPAPPPTPAPAPVTPAPPAPSGGRTRKNPTQLESFIRARGVKPAHLAKESGYSRQHLMRLRMGTMEPTRRCIAALVAGLRRITREDVQPHDIFDMEAGA